MILNGVVSWANSVSFGSVLVLFSIVALFFATRSYISGYQADEIRALRDKSEDLTKQLREAGKEASNLKSELAELRAKTDLSGIAVSVETASAATQARLDVVQANQQKMAELLGEISSTLNHTGLTLDKAADKLQKIEDGGSHDPGRH